MHARVCVCARACKRHLVCMHRSHQKRHEHSRTVGRLQTLALRSFLPKPRSNLRLDPMPRLRSRVLLLELPRGPCKVACFWIYLMPRLRSRPLADSDKMPSRDCCRARPSSRLLPCRDCCRAAPCRRLLPRCSHWSRLSSDCVRLH